MSNASAAALLKLARSRLGQEYLLGALAPKANADWNGPWDCAEFTSWCVFQLTGELFGCRPLNGNPDRADAYSGFWADDARRLDCAITVGQAAATKGAFLVRKLGVPGHEELAMGAIASGGVRTLNEDVVGHLGIGPAAIGRLGEKIAGAWLTANGAKVIYRNFKAPRGGEVDIVARQGRQLLFTEVKTRRAGGIGRPLDAVDRAKERLIERGANEWLRLLGTREIPWRFDVIEVILTDGEKPVVRRVENIF